MNQFIDDIKNFWQPYLIAQLISAVILFMAWKHTRVARGFLGLLFLWASITNAYTILTRPDAYLAYAGMATPLYRDFINGWFSSHHRIMIPLIAAGQLLIATGMALNGWWVQWACWGAIIFLLSIAPLLVGSGFPFSITVSLATWLIVKNDDRNFLWKRGSDRKTS